MSSQYSRPDTCRMWTEIGANACRVTRIVKASATCMLGVDAAFCSRTDF